ncbi:MAG TPA: YbhB/YbcL family Raf kinase inhibitor-like protein [Gemmatimonadaceae bacterium]|jgi:para-nitrobenzyl esterase
MKTRIAFGTLALGLGMASLAHAQQPPAATEVAAAQLALVNVPAKNGAKLAVTTPSFAAGGDFPIDNTQYGKNVFPGLTWTAGPAGTTSYVAIMQDGDALSRGAPILHWTMVNIPATVTTLAAGMTAPPGGAQNGPNMRGASSPFAGPRPPAGPKHRYHIQVFALDTAIPAGTTTYAQLTDAMKGHVLASGEVIGLGQKLP